MTEMFKLNVDRDKRNTKATTEECLASTGSVNQAV